MGVTHGRCKTAPVLLKSGEDQRADGLEPCLVVPQYPIISAMETPGQGRGLTGVSNL